MIGHLSGERAFRSCAQIFERVSLLSGMEMCRDRITSPSKMFHFGYHFVPHMIAGVLFAIHLGVFATLYRQLKSGKWIFMFYFDDQKNYVDSLAELSFFPFCLKQAIRVLSHIGLNVFEPVGSVLKAVSLDVLGPNPSSLRIVSLTIHLLNSTLLIYWVVIYHRNNSSKYKSSHILILSMACSLLYFIHPLNMEVVGWLSAQSYTLALSFTLSANICLEKMIATSQRQLGSAYEWKLQIGALVCYFLACLSKAPAVMLPAAHSLRLVLVAFNSPHSLKHLWPLLWTHSSLMAAGGAVMVATVRNSNAAGTHFSQVTFSSVCSQLIRAMVTVWNFLLRSAHPQDLRGHYNVQEENAYSWQNLWSDNSPSLFPCTLLLVTTLLVVSCHRLSPVATWSYLSALLFWAPCVGFINHGWALLGADRYCYIPLALACPGVVEVLLPLLASCTGEEVLKPPGGTQPEQRPRMDSPQWGRAADLLLSRWCGCVAFGLCLIALHRKAVYQLDTWRDDKTVLLNCIRHDPTDWECHQFLSSWYGHHERNEALGMHHLNLTLALIPNSEPKAQLFKAKTYMELGQREAGCDIYFNLYAAVLTESNKKMERSLQPYVINNYVICRAIRDGITAEHLEMARRLLEEAMRAAACVPDLPAYVVEGLQMHIDIINNFGNGRPYEVSLLY